MQWRSYWGGGGGKLPPLENFWGNFGEILKAKFFYDNFPTSLDLFPANSEFPYQVIAGIFKNPKKQNFSLASLGLIF